MAKTTSPTFFILSLEIFNLFISLVIYDSMQKGRISISYLFIQLSVYQWVMKNKYEKLAVGMIIQLYRPVLIRVQR